MNQETPMEEAYTESDERILLSERDYARFLAILDDPKPPTPALITALRDYRQLRAQFPDNNL